MSAERTRRLNKLQIYRHRGMIRNTIFHRTVQLAHRHREVGSELVALVHPPRILNEWLYQDPIEFEPACQPTEGASEGVGRHKTLARPLIAIGKSAPLRGQRAIRVDTKVECRGVVEGE